MEFPGGPVAATPHSLGDPGIPGEGTRSHMLQLRHSMLHATCSIWLNAACYSHILDYVAMIFFKKEL